MKNHTWGIYPAWSCICLRWDLDEPLSLVQQTPQFAAFGVLELGLLPIHPTGVTDIRFPRIVLKVPLLYEVEEVTDDVPGGSTFLSWHPLFSFFV